MEKSKGYISYQEYNNFVIVVTSFRLVFEFWFISLKFETQEYLIFTLSEFQLESGIFFIIDHFSLASTWKCIVCCINVTINMFDIMVPVLGSITYPVIHVVVANY